jgi:AbiV family abortive infection protein
MPKGELLRGMNLCLRNARTFLKEANLLAKANLRQRAFVLAALAMEEIGKLVLLTLMSHRDRATASDKTLNDLLYKVFYKHNSKIALQAGGRWKGVLYVRRKKHVDPPESQIRQLLRAHGRLFDFLDAANVKDVAELKLRALYVEIDRSKGQFLPPLNIPRGFLSAFLYLAGSETKDAARLRNTFRRARTDSLAEEIITRITKSYDLMALLKQLCSEQTAAQPGGSPQ